jgi:hypothetical protein
VGVPSTNSAGVRPSSERVIDMGELSEVVSRPKPSSAPRASSKLGNSLKKSPKPVVASIEVEDDYVVVPTMASPRDKVIFRIRRLTVGACGIWVSGTGAGLFGAPLGVEVVLNLTAFALLGWGMVIARSFLNQPQVNVVCKPET